MNFICEYCRVGNHEECRGGNWCDCLHRGPSGVWESLSVRLQDTVTDVAYEVTAGVLKLEEYVNRHPVSVPVIPGR